MRNPARSKPLLKDVKTIVIQPDLEFDIYWKDTGQVGIGPSVAVYIYETEILRFDCFGPGKGHYHIFSEFAQGPSGGEHIFWRESSRVDQISRTIWEIEKNLRNLIRLIADPRIRKFEIDQYAIAAKLPLVRAGLDEHLESVLRYIRQKDEQSSKVSAGEE